MAQGLDKPLLIDNILELKINLSKLWYDHCLSPKYRWGIENHLFQKEVNLPYGKLRNNHKLT